MRGFRITPLIVAIIGTIVLLGAPAAMYFLLIAPKNTDIAAQKARYAPNAQYTDPVQGPQLLDAANKSLDDANAQAIVVRKQWAHILLTKNPNIDYQNRWVTWLQWASLVDYDFAPRLNSFLHHTGVTCMTTVGAPSIPSDPNAVPTGLLAAPLPTVTVFGSYKQITNHVASWNRFSRIVLVNGLRVTGYDPFMTGTYTATEYMFTRHALAPGPPVPSDPAVVGVAPRKNISFDAMPGFNGKKPL